MATNWSLAEGAKVILEKEDMQAMSELIKKFPITSVAIQAVGAGNEGNLMFLLQALPIHVTMRKVENAYKDLMNGSAISDDEDQDEDVDDVAEDETEEDEEVEEEPKPKKRGPKPKNKTKAQKNAEHRKREAIRKSEAEAEDEMDEFDVDEETGEVDYSAMTAVELFKLCKERGIKAQPKKPAKTYIELLKKADEEAMAVNDEEEDSDDDWDDEDAPINPPTDSDEDEDDDWDI